MTYEDAMDIGDEVFSEYLPKVSDRTRRTFLVALFAELEDSGALDLDEPQSDFDEDEEAL